MAVLNQILDRPDNERPFVLLVLGYPAEGAKLPAIERKSLSDIVVGGFKLEVQQPGVDCSMNLVD